MISYLVLAPLIASAISGMFSQVINRNIASLLTVAAVIFTAFLSYFIFYQVIFVGQIYQQDFFEWFAIESFSFSWGLYIDSLTAVMLVVVTTVSAFVHIYSLGYMEHDEHLSRFMSYLSLFTFAMLMLVTSNNFMQLFFGWEGVGLCSYLLIGFWFKKETANQAAMKAFIVNRIADVGFILGIVAIYHFFDSVNFPTIFKLAPSFKDVAINILGVDYHGLTVICLLLLIGAMGKSAQFLLHTWLPDAMEGPTPVSALIHAATMVTAGVFLIARCAPLFELAPDALNMVTLVGGITCIFAATIAVAQTDIKKIIAYSTCSQLGYMFFACGVSAYSAAIFHLFTHGFFKALLFLGAGSVIHAMSGEQEIGKMGGLWKKLPFTYLMMWIGSLALAGIYPFAGFYSKDIILEAAFVSNNPMANFAFWCGIISAMLTAFYSWRLLIYVFHGQENADEQVMNNVHEAPFSMAISLMFLAGGAIFVGIAGNRLGIVTADSPFWHELFNIGKHNFILEKAHEVPKLIKYLPLLAGVFGIAMAYLFYSFLPAIPRVFSHSFYPLYLCLRNKWYFDEMYQFFIVKPFQCLATITWQIFDIKIIDALIPNGAAKIACKASSAVSRMQNGLIYNYALVMVSGVVAVLTVCLYFYYI